MDDVQKYLILMLIRNEGLSYVKLGFRYYVLVCPCEYRVGIVVF